VENTDDVPERSSLVHGIILGPLQAHLVDGIQVGDVMLLVCGETTCNYSIGTLLRVSYTEHDGVKEARHITRADW
jgi:hypothetical protein